MLQLFPHCDVNVRIYLYIYVHLSDVDVLLGEPIQAEISAHTGLELAYDSLTTLSLGEYGWLSAPHAMVWYGMGWPCDCLVTDLTQIPLLVPCMDCMPSRPILSTTRYFPNMTINQSQ